MLWCYNPLAGLWYPSQPSTARTRTEDGRSITHVHTHLPTQTACATHKTCLRSAPSVATMLGTCTCAYVCTCWCASASTVTVCHVWEGQVPAFLAAVASLLAECLLSVHAFDVLHHVCSVHWTVHVEGSNANGCRKMHRQNGRVYTVS